MQKHGKQEFRPTKTLWPHDLATQTSNVNNYEVSDVTYVNSTSRITTYASFWGNDE